MRDSQTRRIAAFWQSNKRHNFAIFLL